MQNTFTQILSDSFLEKQRIKGDAIADKVVRKIMESDDKSAIYKALQHFTYNQQPYPEEFPQFLKNYFQSQAILPSWANAQKMNSAWNFFSKNTPEIMGMLGFLSLPYCYAAAKGAQVLYFSEKIRNNTYRRLIETAQFVLDVMQPEAFSPTGKGWVSLLKVRLMHATVRYYLQKNADWNSDWGLPINQEDMAGTNLAFSLITLRGLRKTGMNISTQQADDYIHLWNVIGDRLGINPVLLPQNNKQVFWLDKRIVERHFQYSEAGANLTKALLKTLQDNSQQTLPFPEGFINSYMHFLLGEEIADILQIPEGNWTSGMVKLLQWKNWTESLLSVKFINQEALFLPILRKELKEKPVDFV